MDEIHAIVSRLEHLVPIELDSRMGRPIHQEHGSRKEIDI